MVRAWYMDTAESDQRDEHQCVPPRPVALKELQEKTGVEYFEVPVEGDYSESPELVKIKRDRGYSYEDHVEISEGTLPNYEEKLKNFFTEHLHSDEEIRLVVKGSGYFDVRDPNDEWIRIELVPRDLIILPAGIYHRFTLDRNNYVKAMRFFVGEPIWTPINRPADEHPARVDYLKSLPCQTQVPQKA